ncbi:hypothetical protein [Streptomyces rhizosphaericus]|uniref:Uncharacterized protein n=1 Tax=Streptomyces rhizosphaericus TaxID=114699 RepID=A0A6G4ABM5_9ACTN|nr:hypothetical protein [Streptomyces rhizosphaericus]NEW69887.1 hypothetical protein [Streptomyces rhizosphaericus]
MGAEAAGTGDVTATPGTTPFTGADKGTWTAGEVVETASDKMKAAGAFLIHRATCDFTFSGTAPNGAAVSGKSTVALSATASRLRVGGERLLLNGDEAHDTFGNALKAVSTRPLRLP